MNEQNISQEIKPIEITGVAVVKIKPEADLQFIEYQRQAKEILAHANSEVVTNDAEQKAATNDLGLVSMLRKGIEEHRQLYVKPLNEHVKAVNTAFKTLTEPIEEADMTLRNVIGKYRAEVDRKRREAEAINQAKEELARREAALNDGVITVDITPVAVPDAQPNHVRAEAATLGTAKVWKFEVVDEKLLPNEFKLPDLVKIGKVIRAGVNIPGVRSWQEDSIRISATR